MTIAVNVVRWKRRGRPKGTTKAVMGQRRRKQLHRWLKANLKAHLALVKMLKKDL